METRTRILLAENDKSFALHIKLYLQQRGLTVFTESSPDQALRTFAENKHRPFDLVVVSGSLAEDGLKLIGGIRKFQQFVPIIMLVQRARDIDRIKGLRAGADDVQAKEMSLEEIYMRIQVFLKRSNPAFLRRMSVLQLGALVFYTDQDRVVNYQLGREWKLRKKEAVVLSYLAMHQERAISKKEVLLNIWGNEDRSSRRAMDVHICNITKILQPEHGVSLDKIGFAGFKLNIHH